MSRKGIVALALTAALALPAAAGATSPGRWTRLAHWVEVWSWLQGVIKPAPPSLWSRDTAADDTDSGMSIDPLGRPCPGACRQTAVEPAGTDSGASIDPAGGDRGASIAPFGHP